MKSRVLLLFALLAVHPLPAQETKSPLAIAAAADLVYCLADLDKEFARKHPGADLKVTTGSSGNFFTQLQHGAPFDIFLSADVNFPRELAKAGLADPASLTNYAIGRIVLWTTRADIDVSRGLAVVNDSAVKKFAIANPDHAPYGRAAKAALEHAGLWATATGKLVLGENIAQTAQFVQTGNAEAGIVALSLVLAPPLAKVSHWTEIPPDSYPRLEQGAVITAHGTKNPLAAAYIAFLRSPEARAILDHYGFRLPK
jgi:molybdate transport system substrate-binding protein